MAKNRAPSKHSRAARRATSPGIDTDKSLKEVQPPRDKYERPSVLAVHHSAGVQKKAGKRKSQQSAKAKRRQQRGMDMAEAVMERTSKKMQKSHRRANTVQERRKTWEDINRFAGMAEEEDDNSGGEDDGADKPAGKAAKAMPADDGWETDENIDEAAATEEAAPAAQLDDDLDEIL
ncbi:hypothetical protein K4F52_005317 [Lecanicillium sp. MT-2017a]|nr:hypothetical protein K4F52_005317 [Lecanicillium sp. MT-2017a]